MLQNLLLSKVKQPQLKKSYLKIVELQKSTLVFQPIKGICTQIRWHHISKAQTHSAAEQNFYKCENRSFYGHYSFNLLICRFSSLFFFLHLSIFDMYNFFHLPLLQISIHSLQWIKCRNYLSTKKSKKEITVSVKISVTL